VAGDRPIQAISLLWLSLPKAAKNFFYLWQYWEDSRRKKREKQRLINSSFGAKSSKW
jgi:hypothetical protein